MTARTVGTGFDGRGWSGVAAVDVRHVHPAVLRPGRCGWDPGGPGPYDYRAAALDAMHFPKLVDRLWQNLRRATGFRVQYFAAVEAQRRLAPHLHAAIRGAIPRACSGRSSPRRTTRCGGRPSTSPSTAPATGDAAGLVGTTAGYRRPGHRCRVADVGAGPGPPGRGPGRRPRDAAGARGAVRHPVRRAGPRRDPGGHAAAGGVPDEVPDQVGRRHLRRPPTT